MCEHCPHVYTQPPHRPSLPHLPWLMLMLSTQSALRAVLVSVSITWSLCSTTSPFQAQTRGEVRLCPGLENPPALLPNPPKGAPSAYCPHAAHVARKGCRSGC